MCLEGKNVCVKQSPGNEEAQHIDLTSPNGVRFCHFSLKYRLPRFCGVIQESLFETPERRLMYWNGWIASEDSHILKDGPEFVHDKMCPKFHQSAIIS